MDEQNIPAVPGEPVKSEIVQAKDIPKRASLREVRFAALLNQGMDPNEAACKTVPINAENGYTRDRRKIEKVAARLLKACQDKLLIDISKAAPKAMKKMEQLLEAKEKVYFQGEEVAEKPALEIQRKVASQLVSWAQPKDKDPVPSLFAAVVKYRDE